jgi:hypothetical protein
MRRAIAAAIPAAGILELSAHWIQTASIVPERDWKAAREYTASNTRPADLVVFAPRWTDPIGRETFGPTIANLEREARDDETTFPRAFEVSIRGAHLAALASWRRTAEKRFGGVVVATLENPRPATRVDDFVSRVNSEQMRVSLAQSGRITDCVFVRTVPSTGGLGAGQPISAERFTCPGGVVVSTSIVTDLDYYPHRCIQAPVSAGGTVVRLRFLDVTFGHALHGHHAIYIEADRPSDEPPVSIAFRVHDALIGEASYRDGDGWKPFEFDTSAIAGTRGDAVVEIGASGGGRRMYCFAADTR